MPNDTIDWSALAQLKFLGEVPVPAAGNVSSVTVTADHNAVGLFVIAIGENPGANWTPQIVVTGENYNAQYGFAQSPPGRVDGTPVRVICPIPGDADNPYQVEVTNLAGTNALIGFWADVFEIIGGSPPVPGSLSEQPLITLGSEWFGVQVASFAALTAATSTLVAAPSFGQVALLGYRFDVTPTVSFPSAGRWTIKGHTSGHVLAQGFFNAQSATGNVAPSYSEHFPMPIALPQTEALDFDWSGTAGGPGATGALQYVVQPAPVLP